MGESTNISWANSTFNPWIGCMNVSPGCDHCYAEALDKRWGHDRWGVGKPRQRTSEANWRQPLKWNRLAAESGLPWRVFCASLADVFDNEVPVVWRMELFDLIRRTPALTWMLLTKRIGNAEDMLPGGWYADGEAPCGPFPNAWIGATVVNQEEADRDIPKLLRVPAAVHWLSCEPLLGPIDLSEFQPFRWARHKTIRGARGVLGGQLDWVIVGGESGPHSRPFVLGWAKDIVQQCVAASVAVHVKQLGSNPVNREGERHPQQHPKGGDPAEWPEILRIQQFPDQESP